MSLYFLNNELTKNLLICGDNLKILDDLIGQGIEADLIYLDPPFFSNRHYEVVWGDEAEARSFKDRWAGGINVYIEWMKERVSKMYDVLKDIGSFYLHCDWHAGHYLKVMLDEIFGYKNFRNEIIWCYSTGGTSKSHFGRKHDTLLLYVKDRKKYCFNPLKEKAYIPTLKGRTFAKEKLKAEIDEAGCDKCGQKGGFYHMASMRDIWEIQTLFRNNRERLGYPTQKPEALLDRIIKASSNKNDIVLDPFCGCGTAMAVAHRLNRKWIGIDISPMAIKLTEIRLAKLGAIKGKDFFKYKQ